MAVEVLQDLLVPSLKIVILTLASGKGVFAAEAQFEI